VKKPAATLTMALTAACLVCLAAAADAMTLPDRIIRSRSTAQISGIKIKSADVTGATYQKFPGVGKVLKVPFSDIKDIYWGDMPNDLRRIGASMKNKRYAEALKIFPRLPASGPRNFWYQPYRSLMHAKCLVAEEKYAEAVLQFDVILIKHPKSFYLLEAIQGKAKALLATGDYAKVPDTVKRLESFGPLWKLRGQAQAALACTKIPGKIRQAAKLYEDIVKGADTIIAAGTLRGSLDEVRGLQQVALVGKATVLMADNRPAEARKWIDSVSDKVTDKAARLDLYMALGDLAMDAAGKEANPTQQKAQYKRALLAYMRVYILYPGQKTRMPKALLQAGTASLLLGTPEDKSRARRLFRTVKKDYPTSPQAKKASGQLEALGG
jgi:tetratricopeptide (TPR) repeat protein